MNKLRVRAITLGCKVNAYESEYILSCFKDTNRYIITNDIADIYIINTCSVTNTSDSKCRKVINRTRRENPDSIIVIMGCMVEANRDMDFSNANIVIGNKDKSKVLELVEEYITTKQNKKLLYDDFDSSFEDMFITNMSSHTRAYVKIQDGCENFCSYCIIPYTRGRQRSKNPDTVIEEITELVKNNYKEIVLTGIHTGHYGSDLNTSFAELLERIVKIDGLKRLRISSIEITELDDEFLKVLENNNIIVSHMHIPLQAGSDTILKAMNRKYLTNYFEDKINKIRSLREDISISTDIIVGFPGETEELFQETLEFANKIKFSKIHVFPYSRRKNTVADSMPNQIDESVKKDRVRRLIELSNNLEKEYASKFIGKIVEVLVEESNTISVGHTSNFLKVYIDKKVDSNELVKVKIKCLKDDGLVGEIYE